MLNNAVHIIKNMGLRYTLYRVQHELEKRAGVLKRRHPINPPVKKFVSLEQFRRNSQRFVIHEREKIAFEKNPNADLKNRAERIIRGEVPFFSSEWKDLGKDYDWITNPDNGYRYDINKHWSEIADFSSATGDIKYVWEKSRFTWLLTIIRNDYHHDEDHSGFVFDEIEHWIDANPVNQGPNWRCSQEISLRILNWCFALQFYKHSAALTEERWDKIQHVIYWSLHHVYHHIDFSRIAVRNNHAITETLFLTLSHMLFPFIPETKKWSEKGRKWFEQEIAYQIYEDGTFLQFSMNYHRVVIQLLSLGISISGLNNSPFSRKVYEKAYKSLNFLYQCTEDTNGFLPNYGANDGAWFFPLSDTDYRDFRPQLNTLHQLLTGEPLYYSDSILEDASWMGTDEGPIKNPFPKIKKCFGISEFRNGGYFLIREDECLTFIKCGSYKDRPSHADNLHLDLWFKGENILLDGGSYKYNTDQETVKFFSGTESHNTVMIDHHDQILKGPRFIWLNWSQAIDSSFSENQDHYSFSGSVRCFSYLDKNIIHKRSIKKEKGNTKWLVRDEIINKPDKMKMHQLWHTTHKKVRLFSEGITPSTKEAWHSLYYGSKEKTFQTDFSSVNHTIETIITI